jgi:NAD+ diphosphatase
LVGGHARRVSSPFVPLLLPPDTPVISRSRWFWVQGDRVAIIDQTPDEGWSTHFLGMLGTEACWAVDVPDAAAEAAGEPPVDLRSLWGRVSDVEWSVASRAVQLVAWARTHRFCGRCGTPTAPSRVDRSMRCPTCGLLAYPRLAPAVITLVQRGDEALLARGVQFPLQMYSCLAGFVEPGETLEEAVRREVREEVGVGIDDLRYMGSQPWPFPHSLMIGFFATWTSGEIVIDPTEIVDAGWYRRDALPAIPPPLSIARRLIDRWVADGSR